MSYSTPHTLLAVLFLACLLLGIPYLVYHYTDAGSTTRYIGYGLYGLFLLEFLYFFVFHKNYYTSLNLFMMGEPRYALFTLKASLKKTLSKPFSESEKQAEKRINSMMEKGKKRFSMKDLQRIKGKERELEESGIEVMKKLRSRTSTF